MASYKSFHIGKNFDIRWYGNKMRYFFFDHYHLIIELGHLSIVWIRRRRKS